MKKLFKRLIPILLLFFCLTSPVLAAINIVPNGGTGVGTITGIILGNGTSPFTGLTTSAGIFGAISNETGSGLLVGNTLPTFVGLLTGNAATGPGFIRFLEDTDNGSNYVEFLGVANLSANRQCQFTDSGAPIPDSCVGDGADGVGGDASYPIDLTNGSQVTGSWTGSDNGFTYWNGTNLEKLATDTFFTDGTNIYINHDFWFEKNPSNGSFRYDVAPVPAGEVITGIIPDLFGGSGSAKFAFVDSAVSPVPGNCAQWDTEFMLEDSGSACGSGGSGAPDTVDYLVGTADGGLSAEIVVGTTPGGELGGTWASPTIDDSVTTTGWVMGTFSGTTLTAGTVNIDLLDGVGAVDMDYGSGDITDHTFTTDGTGTAEIVLPAGSIDGTEILNDTVALTTDTSGNYVSSATASGGLVLTGTEGGSLGVLLPAATNALSSTTSSGSGLELVSAGLALLQGCADTEILKWNETTDVWACGADANSGGATAWNDIGDATADGTIVLGAHETDFTSTLDSAGKAIWTVTNTDADTATDTDFISLAHNDGADANIFYFRAVGDLDGTPQTDYRFSQTGAFIRPDVTVTGGVATALIEASRAGHAFDLINTSNSASVQAGLIQGMRSTGVDNDEAYVSYQLANGAGTATEMARETWKATDADSGTGIDAQIEWDVKIANSLTHEMTLSGTGLDLAASDALSFGGVALISDSAGTTTLGNVDAIDGTTETTFEGALDLAGDISATGLGNTVIGADKVLESHLKAVDAAVDEDILTYESTTGDFEWHTCAQITGSADLCDGTDADSGGSTAWDAIGDPSASATVAFGGTTQTITGNTNDVTAIAQDLLSLNFTNDAATDILAQRGLFIQNEASANGMEALIALNNNDADDVVTSGILVNSAAGAITTALDVSDADIVTAVDVGSNNLDLGSAGVRINGDGDGAMTFLGQGNGSDEDLTINLDDTSNEATFSSSTSLALANFSGINLQTPKIGINAAPDASRLLYVTGDVSGGVATIERTNASTNAAVGTVIIKGTSTGDMTDGFGPAFQFGIQDTAAVENLIANIQGTRDGADNSGRIKFTTYNAGVALVAGFFDSSQRFHMGDGTGVSWLDDQDGAVTLKGEGNGSDEDVTFNLDDVANTIGLSSSTGVTDWDFGTIDVNTDTLDLTGTGTINGLDAIDATSESTIEAAIDTLANLTSVQGQTLSLSAPFTLAADPNADRILFWDDSAGATAYLATGNGLTITTTTIAADTASDTVDGVVELATAAETTTGTDATRAVTPDGLAGSDYGKQSISVLIHDPLSSTALTTGDGKAWFEVPSTLNGYNLVGVTMGVSTVSSSGIPTVQVRRNRRNTATTRTDADMLSTKITVDASEFDSVDAATAAVIDTGNDDVQTGDHIHFDVDVAGTGTKGANINLIFQLP